MSLVTLRAPLSLHTYATRDCKVSSDANGIISDVETGTTLFDDLISGGCQVVPPAAPSDSDLPEPVA
jgi:hypothetical protein